MKKLQINKDVKDVMVASTMRTNLVMLAELSKQLEANASDEFLSKMLGDMHKDVNAWRSKFEKFVEDVSEFK